VGGFVCLFFVLFFLFFKKIVEGKECCCGWVGLLLWKSKSLSIPILYFLMMGDV
jgi:hypothetical protein